MLIFKILPYITFESPILSESKTMANEQIIELAIHDSFSENKL